MLNAGRRTACILQAKLTFLDNTVVRRHDCAVRTGEDAGVAADTFIMVEGNDAVFTGQSAGDAAFHAKRFLAVTAGNRKADPFFFSLDRKLQMVRQDEHQMGIEPAP